MTPNPMMTCLPLLMANGTFKSLSSMREDEIENFLCYLVRFTCHKYKLDYELKPSWWQEGVKYIPEFFLGQAPLPYTRNKVVKLKRLIRLCYIYYNCRDLLSLSEKLAMLHSLSYKIVRNDDDDTLTVLQVNTNSPIVMIPVSNIEYDLPLTERFRNLHEITVFPVRAKLITFDAKREKTFQDEPTDCILIEDSSDDDVEIVSVVYNHDLKRHVPKPDLKSTTVSRTKDSSHVKVEGAKSKDVNSCLLSKTKTVDCRVALRRLLPEQTKSLVPSNVPSPVTQKLKPPRTKTAAKKYLYPQRACRQISQDNSYSNIDLTIDDDDDNDPENIACRPRDLTQKSFLSLFNLLGDRCEPRKSKDLPVFQGDPKKLLNMKVISIDMVPSLVTTGIIPKRCLISQKQLENSTNFIEKYTRKDFECSRIVVDVSNPSAVARVVRHCSVRLKRLTTVDFRKWKRRRNSRANPG